MAHLGSAIVVAKGVQRESTAKMAFVEFVNLAWFRSIPTSMSTEQERRTEQRSQDKEFNIQRERLLERLVWLKCQRLQTELKPNSAKA